MFASPYIVEILTPRKSSADSEKEVMDSFAGRYRRILDCGCALSIPDNPMGQLRCGAAEAIELCALPVDSERVFMNLNTFHAKEELDRLLEKASVLGIRYLLVVRGDGSSTLPKLTPESIGGTKNVATSSDLLRYINREYEGLFITGAAFNQYNRRDFEIGRLKEKIEAGAKFVVTQPLLGKDPNVDAIEELGIPVVVEAWMSKNVDLLYKSVRKEKDERAQGYDPAVNLTKLHRAYPENCVYLSMLSFREDWKAVLPRLSPKTPFS